MGSLASSRPGRRGGVSGRAEGPGRLDCVGLAADEPERGAARSALELEQLQGAGRVAGASLAAAEERYRKLVLKLEEMQAIERALERQVLRGWRWRKVWGAVRRAVRRAVAWALLRLLKKIRVVGA